ncbi:MAG: S9 family peptidase [Acidobacteriota bacterium]|nr:S9 family peptidase [Blastocatellia bacterium]MDW8413313.1 S9 family peptidase [Acidobacteriota bacterium]
MRTVLTVLVLSLSALAQQSARGLAVEDLFAFKRISEPQLSPDKKTIAYVISTYDKNGRSSQIWTIPLEGGHPRQFTTAAGLNERPRWSPDSRQLAFISTRDGSPQIWLMDVAGGEARKLTDMPMGASDPVWSPDGKHLLFTSEVYPECIDIDCNRKKRSVVESSPVKAKMLDRLLYRHWMSWKDGKRNHLFIVSIDGGQVKDLTPGDYDVPPFSLGGPDNYAFSPDGKEICYVTNTDEIEATSTNHDLFVLPLSADQKLRRITEGRGADNSPAYSPDGKYIAYRSQQRAGFEADKWRLMLYDRTTGQSRSLTDSLDRSVESIIWAPDSNRIYFTAEDETYQPIFFVEISSGKIGKLIEKSFNFDVSISHDGKTLVFSRSSETMPTEVFAANADGSNVRQITFTNSDLLSQLDMKAAEDFWSKGEDGTPVHSLLMKPVCFDPKKKYPMIVLIHGGPQGAWTRSFSYRWNPNIYAAAGYVVLMPNPRGSTGYGQKFTDQISGDWSGKCVTDIFNAVDKAAELEYVDRNRIGAAGASFGGYMINWILGHNETGRFKALVSHAGVFNTVSMYGVTEELWFPEWEFGGTPWTNPESYAKHSPHNYVKNFKTPTLVTHGELDYRVPIGEGFQLFTALQRMGVPSRMLYFPDEGHWILKPHNSELWYKTVLEWFGKYLK